MPAGVSFAATATPVTRTRPVAIINTTITAKVRFILPVLAGLISRRAPTVRLWFRLRVSFAGRHVDRERDVSMNHLPLTVDLVPHVGHAKRKVYRLPSLIRTGEMLDAVGESHLAVGHDVQ